MQPYSQRKFHSSIPISHNPPGSLSRSITMASRRSICEIRASSTLEHRFKLLNRLITLPKSSSVLALLRESRRWITGGMPSWPRVDLWKESSTLTLIPHIHTLTIALHVRAHITLVQHQGKPDLSRGSGWSVIYVFIKKMNRHGFLCYPRRCRDCT